MQTAMELTLVQMLICGVLQRRFGTLRVLTQQFSLVAQPQTQSKQSNK
jgi:hypothetical protein